MVYREYKHLDGAMFEEFIISGAAKLEQNVKQINDLNVFPIPDGDTGDNMYRTIAGGIETMKKEPANSVAKKSHALAEGMLFNARGNSGVILSQIFAGMANGFAGIEVASIEDIIYAFGEGVKKAYSAVTPPVEGTILTVAREATEQMEEIKEDLTIGEFAEAFRKYMYHSLENTPELLHILKEAGVIDSGGAGLYLIADGIVDAINGENVIASANHQVNSQAVDFSKFTEDSELKFGYCTEILLRLMNKKVDVKNFDENIIIDYLKTIGDSIVAFKNDSIVKVHVHTMTPSKVLEYCQQFGEFLTIKIENMTLQHNESHFAKDELPTVERETKKYGVIVVADGEGFKSLFKELGVDIVIDGGQGKNPSINDFVKAFDEVNAHNIYVFPNNSNIILAANQAKEMYDKSNIYVVETKNVGEAYAALSMLDYSIEPDELFDLFIENSSSENVGTALVCKATRDVELGGVKVKENDYIVMEGKKIDLANPNIVDAVVEFYKERDYISLSTIFYGKNVTEEEKQMIGRGIRSQLPDIELYEADGGQDTFDLVIIIE
ncbi:MAG: DAK2 domain-containing protein [Bacilli bacterium]|nr:DAK2 domain-containing protein [Bacilli bacterium]